MHVSLESRINDALSKWSVIKFIEPHMYQDEIENILNNLVKISIESINRNKSNIPLIKTTISDTFYDFLDDNNIEVDLYSCDGISDIIYELYSEFLLGRCDFYNKVMGIKEVTVPENIESE